MGRCRDAPKRGTVAPMGLEAPGKVGRDVLPSPCGLGEGASNFRGASGGVGGIGTLPWGAGPT